MRQLKLVDREAPDSYYSEQILSLHNGLQSCGYNASHDDVESAWLMYSEDNGCDWSEITGNLERDVPNIMKYFVVIDESARL